MSRNNVHIFHITYLKKKLLIAFSLITFLGMRTSASFEKQGHAVWVYRWYVNQKWSDSVVIFLVRPEVLGGLKVTASKLEEIKIDEDRSCERKQNQKIWENE